MRRSSFSLGGLALGCAVAQAACSSSSGGAGNNVHCGPGTALDASVCYVSGSGETVEGGVDGSIVGDDGGPTAPVTFAGALSAAPASTTALFVTWGAASTAALPDGGGVFTYRVYVATAPGLENFGAPTVVSAPGATSIVIDNGLTASTKYYVVVRAVDASGHEDTNTVEQSATLQADITAPLFAGVTSVTPAPEAGLTIAWAAATDDLTPAAAIVYDIYLSTTAHGENLNLPDAVSLPGATSITVGGLAQASTAYYVVVRAVDAAGNVDLSPESVIELSGMTGPDDVAPVFGGCTSATQVDAQSIAVTWQGATDNSTPAAQIAYDVFAATTEGGQDFSHPSKTFVSADSTILSGGLVDGLKSGTTYYLVCRARDLSSNEDQNTFARVATTAIDSVPPMFAGVTGARNITPTTVDLYWNAPASDDQTPVSQIVYLAYQASTAGG
ncbi:MAG TPA: fibronectin type III domain-containing protein, partial [Polyangiaceae bacterium]|nr:fibronectin type III domain-containing protein [Polyangiaceae bacterium]